MNIGSSLSHVSTETSTTKTSNQSLGSSAVKAAGPFFGHTVRAIDQDTANQFKNKINLHSQSKFHEK